MHFKPEGYQKRATKFMLAHDRCALHIDMGLGKTAAVLQGISQLIENFEVTCVLIVAPLKVATITWPNEIRKWDQFRHLDFQVIRGTEAERELILEEYHDVFIINYDMIDWMVNWIYANRKRSPFDMIVFDESSKLKNHRSNRFKALKPMLLSNMFKREVQMTGTPMPETYLNLWPQYLLLDKGERLGRAQTRFQQEYFDVNPYNRFDIQLRRGSDKKIQNKISDITITMLGEDYLKLPPVIVRDIEIELPEKARSVYEDFCRDMIAEIDDEEILAPSSAAVLEKCRQVACGFVYNSEKEVKHLHNEKFEYLEDIIETSDHNLLVAYYYSQEEKIIRKNWPKAPILGKHTKDKEAIDIVDAWNSGKIKLLFMHPLSVGHGINLQGGGSNLIFITPPWSGEAYDQTIHRLQRKGQENPVVVQRLIIKDSVDEIVYSKLKGKDRTQRAMMRALVDSHSHL